MISPRNDNTVGTDLFTQRVEQLATQPAGALVAPVRAYAVIYEPQGSPANVRQIPNVTAVAETQEDATDFEANSDSTVDNLAVTPVLLSKHFHLNANEQNNGLLLQQLVTAAVQGLEASVSAKILAVVTTANYTSAAEVVAGSFADAHVKTLCGAIAVRPRNLVLSTDYYARLSNINPVASNWTITGFNAVHESSLTGAGETVGGFVCSPGALVVLNGLPLPEPEKEVTRRVIVLPQTGLKAELLTWVSRSSRAFHAAISLYVASAKADPSRMQLVVAPV